MLDDKDREARPSCKALVCFSLLHTELTAKEMKGSLLVNRNTPVNIVDSVYVVLKRKESPKTRGRRENPGQEFPFSSLSSQSFSVYRWRTNEEGVGAGGEMQQV